jgi:hypothetical protein
MPVAVNCCVSPLATLGFGGDTWIDTSVAAVTVRLTAGEVMPSRLALMLVDPAAAADARPAVAPVLLMLATLLAEETQVTIEVRSWVELSVYVPTAVNCRVRPLAVLALGGVTWIDTSAASVTVSDVPAEVTPFRLALICVFPTPVAVARPADPAALVTVATAGSEDAQVTCDVRFWVDWSENTPVAVN